MIPDIVPRVPDWHVDWDAIGIEPWVAPMRTSTQDPINHGEGDVWTHTRMVVESLVASTGWRALPDDRRDALFWAALLHDMAKPQTRTEEDGRIRNPGHSAMGSRDARAVLWRAGVPRPVREMACATIAVHQAPFWLLERPEWQAHAILARTSLAVPPEDVALHATADALGRICPDQVGMLDSVALFALMAADMGATGPATALFANDHARVRYFANPETRSWRDCPPDTTSPAFEVVLMSGLPGSGKTTAAAAIANRRGIPVMSLDALRREMGVRQGDNQGAMLQAAQDWAREHLRRRRGFVWDSTNLTVDQRRRVLGLAHDYGARTHVVSVERPYAETVQANRDREDPVPEAAVARMLSRWEPPTLAECHSVEVLLPGPKRNRHGCR